MRKSLLAAVSAAALVLSFGAANAQVSVGGNAAAGAAGAANAVIGNNAAQINAEADANAAAGLNLTVNDVLIDDPFGDLDIAAATGVNADVQGWINGLSSEQRAELLARCNIIGSVENRSRFDAEATALCDAYTALRTGQAAIGGGAGVGAGAGAAGGVVGAGGNAGVGGNAGGAIGGALGGAAGGANVGAGADVNAGAGGAGVNAGAGANVEAGGAVRLP
jgi:hypothetical protein